jgi:SAM-dependent methyltransferase
MWRHVLRNLARTFFRARVPEPDLAALSPRYCYSLWLRHLVNAWQSGVRRLPEVVVELGPGSSQGVGLAALLSGGRAYTSLDAVDYQVARSNAEILEELIELFARRAPVPGPDEFPHLRPALSSYEFPTDVLNDQRLGQALDRRRLDAMRAACRNPGKELDGVLLRHVTTQSGRHALPDDYADMILSQSVLTYVPDLEDLYRAMYRWLKPGGCMTHQCHYSVDLTFSDPPYWNSHWGCSDRMWSLLKWKQTVVVNRHPHSAHLEFLQNTGFRILREVRYSVKAGLPRRRLAARFRGIPDDDLSTGGAFLVALKP